MTKYKKKPVTIDAWSVRSLVREFDDLGPAGLPPEIRAAVEQRQVVILGGQIQVRTLEGQMHALEGDYIIRGVEGEFYPCKPGIFAATYDMVL